MFKIFEWLIPVCLAFSFAAEPCAAQSNATQSSPISPTSPLTHRSGPCDQYYPWWTTLSKSEGEVLVNVHILPDGTISQAAIAQSSGEPALDAAALTCAQNGPKLRVRSYGQPVEVDWEAKVIWRRDGHSFFVKAASPDCPASIYPMSAITNNRTGRVEFIYMLGVDGKVENWLVTRSSGVRALDKAVVNCVTGTTYPVATQSGRPIPVDMSYAIWFGLNGSIPSGAPQITLNAQNIDDAVKSLPCSSFLRVREDLWAIPSDVSISTPLDTIPGGTFLDNQRSRALSDRCQSAGNLTESN